jgi:hypothetical protein
MQHRAVAPTLRPAVLSAQNISTPVQGAVSAQMPREAISYTVPLILPATSTVMPPARLTNYVFAHSKYSSGLDQRGVLADLLIEGEEQQPAANEEAPVAP